MRFKFIYVAQCFNARTNDLQSGHLSLGLRARAFSKCGRSDEEILDKSGIRNRADAITSDGLSENGKAPALKRTYEIAREY